MTKAEVPEWDLGNLNSAAGLGWFHLLCDLEVTSIRCKPAPLSLLSPWYKAFWIRLPAIMMSLTALGIVTIIQKITSEHSFCAFPSCVILQQTFMSGFVSIGPESFEL